MNTRAHVRVGAAATAAFLLVLALTLIQRPDVAPAAAPAATSTAVPQQTPDFDRRGGRGFRGGGPGGGGFAPSQPEPQPNSDGGFS